MRFATPTFPLLFTLGFAAVGCGSSDDGGGGGGGIPVEPVRLTTEVTLVPELAPMSPADGR